MTITISEQAHKELFQEAEATTSLMPATDQSNQWDRICQYPPTLGQGLIRGIRLREGIWLSIYDYQLHDELVVRGSDYFQGLGFSFFLQGEYTYDDVLHEAGQHLVCGSGNEAAAVRKEFIKQRFLQIDVGLQPGVLRSFISDDSGELPPQLQHLVHSPEESSNWHLGTTTPVMQSIARQILHCPYQGISRRIDLESKALQLLALLVEQEIELHTERHTISTLKPGTLERIYYAREILLRHLDCPPSLSGLAQQVKLNEYTLKKGFHQVFGTTVFGYLHDYRLEQARLLLQAEDMKTSEVAQAVGFANRGYFAALFRQKFGLNPKEYRKQRTNDRW
ncbi:helix-turn-helix transcriptional regulator [Nostoc sp.]|uniref:helix-turn-helix transcriptional regulator n=1 Tax=Nostoc sp. TaxID=1180 RepID=UPI002FF5AF5F